MTVFILVIYLSSLFYYLYRDREIDINKLRQFGLVPEFNGTSTFIGYLKTKAMFIEEQSDTI